MTKLFMKQGNITANHICYIHNKAWGTFINIEELRRRHYSKLHQCITRKEGIGYQFFNKLITPSQEVNEKGSGAICVSSRMCHRTRQMALEWEV